MSKLLEVAAEMLDRCFGLLITIVSIDRRFFFAADAAGVAVELLAAPPRETITTETRTFCCADFGGSVINYDNIKFKEHTCNELQ